MKNAGVPNINIAVALFRLKPIYKLLESFRSPAFFKGISQIIFGTSTVQSERTLLLMIAETYTHLYGERETFDEALQAQLYQLPVEIEPDVMIKQLGNLAKAMKGTKGKKAFEAFTKIAPELPMIIATAITLKPFINEEEAKAIDALSACDRLLTTYFFEEKKSSLKLNDQEFLQVVHFGSLFNILGHIMAKSKDKSNVGMLKAILDDKEIRTAVKCNEYQGVTWYNKELMQNLIVLSALSYVTLYGSKGKFVADEYIAELLQKESLAEYKLNKLLKD